MSHVVQTAGSCRILLCRVPSSLSASGLVECRGLIVMIKFLMRTGLFLHWENLISLFFYCLWHDLCMAIHQWKKSFECVFEKKLTHCHESKWYCHHVMTKLTNNKLITSAPEGFTHFLTRPFFLQCCSALLYLTIAWSCDAVPK